MPCCGESTAKTVRVPLRPGPPVKGRRPASIPSSSSWSAIGGAAGACPVCGGRLVPVLGVSGEVRRCGSCGNVCRGTM